MAQSRLFLDTAYIHALFNTRDQWHSRAIEWEETLEAENRPLVTTQRIGRDRKRAVRAAVSSKDRKHIHNLQDSPHVDVIPVTPNSFARAFELFEQRPDKDWGLTDCFSFVVMQEYGISDALTTDDHFRQAGFNALLLD